MWSGCWPSRATGGRRCRWRRRRCAGRTARARSRSGCAAGSPPSESNGTCIRARRGRPIITTTPACTEVVVEDGRVAVLRPGPRLAPRVLSRGLVVRVALVPVQAGPLNGDHDRVRLHVGAGCTLVLVPIAATLALPRTSRLDLHATVEGVLELDEPPLIVAEGADVM